MQYDADLLVLLESIATASRRTTRCKTMRLLDTNQSFETAITDQPLVPDLETTVQTSE